MTGPIVAAAGLLVLAGLGLLPLSASASEVLVSPRDGESLEEVAIRVYGEPRRAAVLARHNDLSMAEPVPGQQLRAPFSGRRTIQPEDTWSSLAAELLKDPTLADDLALLVAGSRSAALEPGSSIAVPIWIPEQLGSGETLAGLSRRHYFTSGRATLLARVNGVKDPRRLQVGAPVRVPVVLLSPEYGPAAPAELARAGTPAAPPTRAAAPRAESVPEALPASPVRVEPGTPSPELEAAIRSYRDGEYELALERLTGLQPDVAERADPVEQRLLLEHLVYVQVAFDRPDEACQSYGKLRSVSPGSSFDPDLVSPKIRQLVERCNR